MPFTLKLQSKQASSVYKVHTQRLSMTKKTGYSDQDTAVILMFVKLQK